MHWLLLLLSKLFGMSAPSRKHQADSYPELRNKILTTKPQQLGLTHDNYPHTVWGAAMETGYSHGTVTLVGLCDGTASLYFSSGGGILGAGQHPGPNKAAAVLVQTANDYTSACLPVTQFPYPRQGETRFYLLTFTGVISATALENELGQHRHPLSPLFYAAQTLITQIRLLEGEEVNREQWAVSCEL